MLLTLHGLIFLTNLCAETLSKRSRTRLAYPDLLNVLRAAPRPAYPAPGGDPCRLICLAYFAILLDVYQLDFHKPVFTAWISLAEFSYCPLVCYFTVFSPRTLASELVSQIIQQPCTSTSQPLRFLRGNTGWAGAKNSPQPAAESGRLKVSHQPFPQACSALAA